MSIKINAKLNLVKIEDNEKSTLHKYVDDDNVMHLYIFKSGWKDYYECIEEWGEYEKSELKLLDAKEISKIYGIKTFLRKEKINEINESLL